MLCARGKARISSLQGTFRCLMIVRKRILPIEGTRYLVRDGMSITVFPGAASPYFAAAARMKFIS